MHDLIGFGLICGHMVGDFILQNDWQALNKSNKHPGKDPLVKYLPDVSPIKSQEDKDIIAHGEWISKRRDYHDGHVACTIHCLLYTIAIATFSCWWMPWWGLVICFLVHWPIDRFRLAYQWMVNISNQEKFATGALAPWSIIVIDQCFHLVTLFIIASIALC